MRSHFIHLHVVLLGCLLTFGSCVAAPTESRAWKSMAGTTIEAKATSLAGGVVTLESANGRVIKVELTKLSEEDRVFLEKHFGASAGAASTGTPAALAYPLGTVSGPIEAEGSHYYVYLPKSLKEGRKAPLLFYTHSGGGNSGRLNPLIEGAEICGWILAVSVESKNGMDRAATQPHMKHCLTQILATLPVDPKRVYFSGSSGGTREAFSNSLEFDGAGVLAVIAGAQPSELEKKKNYFFITGATDFNRYEIARSYTVMKPNAALRFHPGGHGDGPAWLKTEGMVWLESKGLQKWKDAPERADFEAAALDWVGSFKAAEPYRAAWWAEYLSKAGLSASAQAKALAISKECGSTPDAVAYSKGLADIEKFAEDVYAEVSGGSAMEHTTPEIEKKANTLLEKYTTTPWVKDVIAALKNKTGKL